MESLGFLYGRSCRGGRCLEIFDAILLSWMVVFIIFSDVVFRDCTRNLLLCYPSQSPSWPPSYHTPNHRCNPGRYTTHHMAIPSRIGQTSGPWASSNTGKKSRTNRRNDAIVSIILVHAWPEFMARLYRNEGRSISLDESITPSSYPASGYASNPLQRKRCRQISNSIFTPSRKSRRSI